MSASVVRIELDGPGGAGLEPLELDPAIFQSAVPTQHHFEYFSSESEGLNVGVWDTTTMQEVFASYPTDEFIVVFEGAFDPDDRFLVGGADGRMTLWKIERKAKHLPIRSFSSHQFIHVLDAALELESSDGEIIRLDAGQTVFIPRDVEHGWYVPESLSAYRLKIHTSTTR